MADAWVEVQDGEDGLLVLDTRTYLRLPVPHEGEELP